MATTTTKRTSNQGYCVKCKATREMRNPTSVMLKNNRTALRGSCPTCKTVVHRIVGKAG